MNKWYWRDGSLAVDMSSPNWIDGMKKVEERLKDPAYKIVKQEVLPNGLFVSTVWLGLDYGFPLSDFGSPVAFRQPVIFETMVFPKKGVFHELDMYRYCTEEEALAGHQYAVDQWKQYFVTVTPNGRIVRWPSLLQFVGDAFGRFKSFLFTWRKKT